MTVVICRLIDEKMNQSAREFIQDSMDYDQFCEYIEPGQNEAAFVIQTASVSFTLFSAAGGLTGLVNIGKSLCDRVCNHLAS